MRISDWSSDVCSSDLRAIGYEASWVDEANPAYGHALDTSASGRRARGFRRSCEGRVVVASCRDRHARQPDRSEEHTSELQSLMRISYAVFCLKNKKQTTTITYKLTDLLPTPDHLNISSHHIIPFHILSNHLT